MKQEEILRIEIYVEEIKQRRDKNVRKEGNGGGGGSQ